MSTPLAQTTAVIYDFATHARALRAAREQAGVCGKSAVSSAPSDLPKVSFCEASYHEAALLEADDTRRQ